MDELIAHTAIRLVRQVGLVEAVFEFFLTFRYFCGSESGKVHFIYSSKGLFQELRLTCVVIHLLGKVVTNVGANGIRQMWVFLQALLNMAITRSLGLEHVVLTACAFTDLIPEAAKAHQREVWTFELTLLKLVANLGDSSFGHTQLTHLDDAAVHQAFVVRVAAFVEVAHLTIQLLGLWVQLVPLKHQVLVGVTLVGRRLIWVNFLNSRHVHHHTHLTRHLRVGGLQCLPLL